MHIDCVYIITLEKLTDQYVQHLHSKLATLKIDSYGFHIMKAVNGADIPESEEFLVYDEWDITKAHDQSWVGENDHLYEYWNRPVTLGEIGCQLSHIKCWEDAHKAGLNNILVLEQDFIRTKDSPLFPNEERGVDWEEISSVDCDIFMLGNFHAGDDPGEPFNGDERFKTNGTFLNSHAYLVNNKEAIAVLANSNARDNIIVTDEFLPAITHPHRRADIRKIWEPKLTAVTYAIEEFPICQTDNHRRALAGENTDAGRKALAELKALRDGFQAPDGAIGNRG